MGRRPSVLTRFVVASLLAASLLAPLLPTATAAPYGSHVYQANPYVVLGAQFYPIYRGSTVAQSFLVNQTYALENVTLRVLNLGNDLNALNVSIHPDDPATHLPVMGSTLASRQQVTATNATLPSNVSWWFSPTPVLEEGQTYWIVAQNTAPQSNSGYEWFSTNGTTYPEGQAFLESPTWAGLPVDMFFITFGQQVDANLTPATTASRSQAQPGDSVTFTVDLNNTGASVASRVWVNDTLSPAFTNVSLGFPGIHPRSAAAFPNLVFPNVTNGPHSFTVTAQVAVGTRPGSVATNGVSLAYTNETGIVVQAGSAAVSVRIGLVTKELYLRGSSASNLQLSTTAGTTAQTLSLGLGSTPVSFSLAPALARPFQVLGATVTIWAKSQHAPPQNFVPTLSLLDNGTSVVSISPSFTVTATGLRPFSFSFPITNYTFGTGHLVRLQVTNPGGPTGSSDALVLGYNSTTNDSQLDALTDTYVSVQDLALSNQEGVTADWSPLDSLDVQANVTDPFGASRIAGAWVNITDPAGRLAASGAMTPVLVDNSSLPAWKRFAFSLAAPLTTGTYRIVVTAMEDNGVTTLAQAFATVTAPDLIFASAPSTDRVGIGQTFAVFLYYNNTGTGSAGPTWINDTLPAGLAYVTSGLPYTSVSGSTYTWALASVAVGANVLELDLRVASASVDWVQNVAHLDYQDHSGHTLGTAWSNASVFLNGPIIALTLTSLPSTTVHGNETVTYTVTLANTGAAAGAAWVNLTLPSAFGYAGTNATVLGGAVTASRTLVQVAFLGMPGNTSWQFSLVAVAGPTLVRNATYVLRGSAVYASSSGTLMPYDNDSLGLVAASPWIPNGTLTFLTDPAMPGSNVTVVVAFVNQGNEPASRLWVNVTLDPLLSMNNASLPFTDVSGTTAFALTDVAVGPFSLSFNATVSADAADRSTLTLAGTLEAEDAIGNSLPAVTLGSSSVPVAAARLSLSVTPQAPRFEAGIPTPLGILVGNSGHDTAANVWLNLTLPFGLSYVNGTASVAPSASGSVYTWHWMDVAPGTISFGIELEARATLTNGTAATLAFTLAYQDSDLRLRPGLSLDLQATVIAPSIAVSVTANAARVAPGAILVYTVHMTNLGMTTAGTVYLVDSVDSRLQVITYAASVAATEDNGTLVWTFPGLAPGATLTVNLTVQVAAGVAAGTIIPNVFEVTYTNSAGAVLGRVRATPVIVTVDADYSALLWVGMAAVLVALLAAGVLRWKKVEIEDVFLVYRDGVLISHLSRTLLREKDEDVLSGMLTAVQEFVRDAFQYGEHRDLHQLDFGDYRILIERGKYVFLAVVYSGKESLALHRKIRAVISRVETEFGTALEAWDGDMERVMGARDLVRDTLLGSANHNHAAKPTLESE